MKPTKLIIALFSAALALGGYTSAYAGPGGHDDASVRVHYYEKHDHKGHHGHARKHHQPRWERRYWRGHGWKHHRHGYPRVYVPVAPKLRHHPPHGNDWGVMLYFSG